MLHIERILFAQDFSESSRQALPFALDLARRMGAELHVVHVDVLHTGSVDSAMRGSDHDAELERRLRRLTEEQAPGAYDFSQMMLRHALVRDVAPAPGLLNYADEHDIDLIVMGTHGRHGVRQWLLGSVAREVVRMAGCPVLTIRQKDEPPQDPTVRRILVPVDFSEHSRKALRLARVLAQEHEAPVDLLHVVEETLHPAFYNISFQSIYDVDPHIEDKAAESLRAFYEETPGPAVPFEVVVRPGHAAREIVRYAGEEDVDLLVMATHGLTGLEHFLLGSIAEKVVTTAPCPVFTVKSFVPSLVDSAGSRSRPVVS